MTKLKKLITAATFALLGSFGLQGAAKAEPWVTQSSFSSYREGRDGAREAYEREQLLRFVARLGAQERAELERYIWFHRLDFYQAARARAHLAEKQRIRDAEDFRHLADQQRLRAIRNAERAWNDRPSYRW